MSLKEQSWFPYVSVAGWALATFVLVLVNSGSMALAAGLAAVVAVISWRIDAARRS